MGNCHPNLMAITKTIIINKALTQIGAARVTSIDDGSAKALLLTSVYEAALRSVLSECKWNFATKRAALATNSTITLGFYDVGQTIVYDRPTDVIQIHDTAPANATWRDEGDYIISDSSDMALRYVYYLDDVTKYPIYFVDALIDKLSVDIAYVVVNDKNLAETFIKKYEGITLPKAVSMNSQVGQQQVPRDEAWLNSKYTDGSIDS